MRFRLLPVALFALLAPCLLGCSSDAKTGTTLQLLDPATPHYGKTYAEWAAAWVSYLFSMTPPDCVNPVTASSGTTCGLYQDPASPVFFLAGNVGGTSVRSGCVVPNDKALFFPVLEVSGDNAGVPTDALLSDADLKSYVEMVFASMVPGSLVLSVDGQSVPNLEQTATQSAPYLVDIPAGDNAYSCLGVPGVEGQFKGYVAGYWALLAPLSPGAHSLSFGGSTDATNPVGVVHIDMQYPDITFQ